MGYIFAILFLAIVSGLFLLDWSAEIRTYFRTRSDEDDRTTEGDDE